MTRPTLAALVVVLACEQTPREAAPVVWEGEITHAIGDAREDTALGRVTGLALAPDGRVVATDGVTHRVHVYAASGQHAFSFGRAGAGPTDFTSPCCVTFDRHGVLWVRDEGNARFTAYRLEKGGAVLASLVRGGPNIASTGERLDIDDHDLLSDLQAAGIPGTGRVQTLRVARSRDGRAVRVDSLPLPPRDSVGEVQVAQAGGTATYSQPFGAQALLAVGGGGQVASAVSTHYAVRWQRPGTAGVQITRRTPTGPAVDTSELRETEAWLGRLEQMYRMPRTRLGLVVPTHKTPLRSLGFDQSGRLWVTFTAALGARPEADVFTAGVTDPMRVTWPADVDLRTLAVRDTVGIGVRIGSDGAESLVALRWRARR